MPTQKELLEKHREGLDAKYKAKYPNGRFALQYFERGGFWAMHWAPRRDTSHSRYRGISVRYRIENKMISNENHQNSAFGKCNNYDTLAKVIAGAHRAKCPAELIAAFLQRYENRSTEGFEGLEYKGTPEMQAIVGITYFLYKVSRG